VGGDLDLDLDLDLWLWRFREGEGSEAPGAGVAPEPEGSGAPEVAAPAEATATSPEVGRQLAALEVAAASASSIALSPSLVKRRQPLLSLRPSAASANPDESSLPPVHGASRPRGKYRRSH